MYTFDNAIVAKKANKYPLFLPDKFIDNILCKHGEIILFAQILLIKKLTQGTLIIDDYKFFETI